MSDTGYGMPPWTLERVFEMFFPGDDSRQPENSGLGIGLPLAKSLVEMHGGRISASSRGVVLSSTISTRRDAFMAPASPFVAGCGRAAEPRAVGRRISNSLPQR